MPKKPKGMFVNHKTYKLLCKLVPKEIRKAKPISEWEHYINKKIEDET